MDLSVISIAAMNGAPIDVVSVLLARRLSLKGATEAVVPESDVFVRCAREPACVRRGRSTAHVFSAMGGDMLEERVVIAQTTYKGDILRLTRAYESMLDPENPDYEALAMGVAALESSRADDLRALVERENETDADSDAIMDDVDIGEELKMCDEEYVLTCFLEILKKHVTAARHLVRVRKAMHLRDTLDGSDVEAYVEIYRDESSPVDAIRRRLRRHCVDEFLLAYVGPTAVAPLFPEHLWKDDNLGMESTADVDAIEEEATEIACMVSGTSLPELPLVYSVETIMMAQASLFLGDLRFEASIMGIPVNFNGAESPGRESPFPVAVFQEDLCETFRVNDSLFENGKRSSLRMWFRDVELPRGKTNVEYRMSKNIIRFYTKIERRNVVQCLVFLKHIIPANTVELTVGFLRNEGGASVFSPKMSVLPPEDLVGSCLRGRF